MTEPIGQPGFSTAERARARTIGTVFPDAIPVFVNEATLETIIDYSEQDRQHEIGGFLIGATYDDRGPLVVVHEFLPAVDARSRAASLRFTHDTWSAMTRGVERRFPDLQVVGWHHTHPDFGVFLSGYDRFIHRHFFAEPWQVAMVVDPCRHELGMFQWRGDDIVNCGFRIV